MAESDVARIRRQIEEECQAMTLALTGYAVTGKHEIIANRFKALDDYHKELGKLVGEQEATEITVTIYSKAMK